MEPILPDTGYGRKYAIRFLHGRPPGKQPERRGAAALWPARALTKISSHIAQEGMVYNSCRS